MKSTKADAKGRITLGLESAGREFVVIPNGRGYRVEPVKTITVPEDEAWLWENPVALGLVLKGIEQSKNGVAGTPVSLDEFTDVDLDE